MNLLFKMVLRHVLKGLPISPLQPGEVDQAKSQVAESRDWNGEADLQHAGVRQTAEEIGQRNAQKKRGQETLRHDKGGVFAAIKVAEKAEGDGDHQIFKGAAAHVEGRCGDHFWIRCKENGQFPAKEEGQREHKRTEEKRNALS